MPVGTPSGSFASSPQQGGGSGVFGNPGPQGGSPSDQAQGAAKYLGVFGSTAYGPPWTGIQGTGVTADGTDLRPARKVYGVAVDPHVIKLGTYLNIQPNPFGWNGTFLAFDTGGAIKGKRIDFYDWRGRASQQKWGRKNVQVYVATDQNQKLDPPATGGGIGGVHIPNPLNAVDDAAQAVKSFIDFVLSPKSIGELLAKITAYVLRFLARAIWNYVFAPLFHWHQRAVLYYYSHYMVESEGPVAPRSVTSLKGFGGFVTLSFWATGYAILWASVDKDDRSLLAEPHKTPLGSLIRAFGNTKARRKLVKPKDVRKKTPQKPEPVKSSARMTRQATLTTLRKRTVKVGGTNGGPDELSGRDHTGRTGDDSEAATAEGPGTP